MDDKTQELYQEELLDTQKKTLKAFKALLLSIKNSKSDITIHNGLKFIGTYQKHNVVYMKNDVVAHDGAVYVSIRDANSQKLSDKDSWTKLVDSGSDGQDAKDVFFRNHGEWVQWRYEGGDWENLIALSLLKGEKGDPGDPGIPGKDGKVGKDGEDGKTGEDGEKGDSGDTPNIEFRVNKMDLQYRVDGGRWITIFDLRNLVVHVQGGGGGGSSGGGTWGTITGTLSDQTDLQNALDAKQDTITDSDDITEGASNLFLTSDERTTIGNQSGTNTGDQTLPVKATGAETDTGTDDAKFTTAKALKDSHNVPSVSPGADGNVLTSDGTDWVSETPTGGGGQTLYDAVLDASGGGDYTDFSTAIAALSAGDTLFIRNGSYSESSEVDFATDDITLVGESRQEVIITLSGSGHSGWTGDNLTLRSLQIRNTGAGRLQLLGDGLVMYDVHFYANQTAIYRLQTSSNDSRITNCYFEYAGGAEGRCIAFGGFRVSITGNTFVVSGTASNESSINQGTFYINLSSGAVTGNMFYVTGEMSTGSLIHIQSAAFSGNFIFCENDEGYALSVGGTSTASGNNIVNAYKGIYCYGGELVISGNYITANGTNAIGIEANSTSGANAVITGNLITGNTTNSKGILITDTDNAAITGNVIKGQDVGVELVNSTVDNTVIVGNSFSGCTTDIDDSGTGTVADHNSS